MTDRVLERRLRWYQAATLFSVMFALLGFSYNVWRMEQTEHNSSVREASFEMLLQLAELERIYQQNQAEQLPWCYTNGA